MAVVLSLIRHRVLRGDRGRKVGREVVRGEDGKPVRQAEPRTCPIFAWTHKFREGKPPYRISAVGEQVREAARQARRPVANPEEVRPHGLRQEQLDQLYERCRDFEAGERV
jgi:hypothetical protein